MSQNIRALMALTRTSGQALGVVLDKDKSTVSRKLNTGTWTVEDLDRLARHWGVSAAKFFEDPNTLFGLGTPNPGWIIGCPEQLDLFGMGGERRLAECA